MAPTSRVRATTASTCKRANVPDDLPPDELTMEPKELLANPAGEERELGPHPETGLPWWRKNGRYGPYVTEVLPEDAPKTGEAAHGLAVQVDGARHRDPRRRAEADVAAARRRQGRRRRRDHRAERPLRPLPEEGHRLALPGAEDQLFTITLDEALAIYAQPKQRGRAAASRR